MFHTLDKTEISILRDFGEAGEKTWPYVELAIFDSYFMCLVTEKCFEENGMVLANRNFLLSFPKDVSDLIDRQNEHFKVSNIDILTPRNAQSKQIFDYLKVTQLLRGENCELTFLTENNIEINFGTKTSNMNIIYEST